MAIDLGVHEFIKLRPHLQLWNRLSHCSIFLREFKLRIYSFKMSYQLLHSSPCLFQIKLGFINRFWSKCFINHQFVHTENDLESMEHRQQDVMIDMSMVYCWLNLRHQQNSHKFFVIYVCIPQYVSDCFFWLLWPLFHEFHQNVVLLKDWMNIELLCLLFFTWSPLDPVDSPNLSIFSLLSQNYLHCMNTLL